MRFLLLLLLFFASIVNADEFVLSIKKIMTEKGEVHVNANRTGPSRIGESKLDILWKSKKNILYEDSYKQEWKSTTPEELAFLDGPDAKNFILMYGGKMTFAKTKSVRLMVWGCDGRIVPLLNLGEWPFNPKSSDWGGVAIEVSQKYGLPILVRDKNESDTEIFFSIPKIKELNKSYKDLGFSQLVWEKLPHIKVFLFHYGYFDEYSGEDGIAVYNLKTEKITIHNEREVLGGRC